MPGCLLLTRNKRNFVVEFGDLVLETFEREKYNFKEKVMAHCGKGIKIDLLDAYSDVDDRCEKPLSKSTYHATNRKMNGILYGNIYFWPNSIEFPLSDVRWYSMGSHVF